MNNIWETVTPSIKEQYRKEAMSTLSELKLYCRTGDYSCDGYARRTMGPSSVYVEATESPEVIDKLAEILFFREG